MAALKPISNRMQEILACLQSAPMRLMGEFSWGSNATYLVALDCAGEKIVAVYKPVTGEQPLWDFQADSLAMREVAAYWLSEALGWGLVPPTVFREDGPQGAGSLQWRVAHDPQRHYFNFTDEQKEGLRPTALFDVLANNADRKGGHILLGEAGHFWLIDQGLCFHAEPKLRTVVWDFMGTTIPQALLDDLERLHQQFGALREKLMPSLTTLEIDALEGRLHHLINEKRFPMPPEDARAVPYPLV
jgi:uncharacterized repeat protein (TIGR03843 family)